MEPEDNVVKKTDAPPQDDGETSSLTPETTGAIEPQETAGTNGSQETTGVSGQQVGLTGAADPPDSVQDTTGATRAIEETADTSNQPSETRGIPPVSPEDADASSKPQESFEPQTPLESVDDPQVQQLADADSAGGRDITDANPAEEKTTVSPHNQFPLVPQDAVDVANVVDISESKKTGPITVPNTQAKNEGKKNLSIDKINRFSFKLASMRAKQFQVTKKLLITETARPTFSFADLEIKTALQERKPEKELLLYLYSENKRMEEKCFFGEIESKKCQVMTSFYTSQREIAVDVLETISAMTHNADAELYLQTVKDDLLKTLREAKKDVEKHEEAMIDKNKEYQKIAVELMKSSLADGRSQQLKTKLQKGTLTDDEILQLSLAKCRDTNSKLKAAIQAAGVQIDNLREQYLRKKDAFVCKLSADFDFSPFEAVPTTVFDDTQSNPTTPTGSMFDFILDKDTMVGKMARIGKNTEDLIKYHNRLKDLKSRIIAGTGFEAPCSNEGSLIAVLSGRRLPLNFNPNAPPTSDN